MGGEGQPGMATDAQGNPVVDPTKNVLDLVEAAVGRLNDLRAQEARRQDELREAGQKHSAEMARLRATYEDKLRAGETARIDAIRAVDVGNVQRAAEVQATQALALANQVTASADALRTQVASAAEAQARNLAAALEPIQKDIQDLRRAQYEQQGARVQVGEQRLDTGSLMAQVFGAIGVLTAIGALLIAFTR